MPKNLKSAAVRKRAGAQVAQQTREKILTAARRHFAKHGLQMSSIRAITRLAGVNEALISYHFGSKRQLYEEVLNECAMHVNYPRLAALDELERQAAGKAVAIESLIRVFVSPYLTSANDPDSHGAIFLRFFGRRFTEPTDDLLEITRSKFATMQHRFVVALTRALPHVRKKDVYLRYSYLIAATAFAAAHTGVLEQYSDGEYTTREPAFWDNFVRTWCDIMRAPAEAPANAGRADARPSRAAAA